MNKDFDSDFEVALLIDDPTEAKEISEILRPMGIFAHFYRNLDEMWVAINAQTPDFAIIDVTKMSQGSLLFQNHPKIQNHQLAFCFYYKESTHFLLNSTYHLNHYGYLKKELNLAGQMQAILRRRNEELRLINKNKELDEKFQRVNSRTQKLMETAQVAMHHEEHLKTIDGWLKKMETVKSSEQFVYRMLHVLCDENSVETMSAYVLNRSGDKLAAPHFQRTKYKNLPSLWLGKRSDQGLQHFAIDMAEQVAMDQMSKDFITVKVSGVHDNPDILLFVKFDVERWIHFPWDLVERFFSNLYRKSLINYADPEMNGVHFKPIWDTLNQLDDIHFHIATAERKAINVNFSPLLNLIQQKHSNRFYWKDFYHDFIAMMEEQLGMSAEISMNGISHMLVMVKNAEVDKAFESMKKIIYNFQYYRYFEDPALVITRTTYPEIKMIAPSSVNYLRSLDKLTAIETDLAPKTTMIGGKRNLEISQ